MRRLRVGALCLALSTPLSVRAERAQSSRTSLGAPASERKLSREARGDRQAVEEGDRTATERASEREGRHYFRERPDALGQAAREKEQQLLAELLQDREKRVVARRREAMALLERFIAEEPESAPEMADALLRLSELTWELDRLEYLMAFDAWQKAPAAHRSKVAPTPDYTRTLALYQRIIDKHPTFPRRDFVIYMKAFALLEGNDSEGALALFRSILRDFPESRFRPDAHMALAEHTFNTENDFRAALVEYDRVLGYDQSELYELALFKSAWCLWQLGNKTQAAVRFRRVLDIDTGGDVNNRRKRLRELQTEALEYLIQVFTEDERNRAADVRRFLQEIGGEQHVERVLIRLSATYFDQARFAQGIEAYALLLTINPASHRAPDYQIAIARGHMALDDFDAGLSAYKTLATDYTPRSVWATQQTDPERVRAAHSQIERVIREQGLTLHELGQRDDRKEYFEQAADIYRVYRAHFDHAKESYRLTFYLGDILFHRLGQNTEAGEVYLAVARKNPTGEFTRDALYNAIGAFERVREREISQCSPDVPCSETDNDRKFSQAIELYAHLYPNDPDLPEILFRQGNLYYERHIYDPAVRLFGQLLDRYPASPFATQAGELLLDSFNRAADYENIEKWARKLKGAPAFAHAASQTRLDGLILGAVFKLGEQRAQRGEHARAAEAYTRAAKEFPRDPRAPKAYYNAGLEWQREGELERADTSYMALVAKYPGSEEGALGAWNGAQMYESIAQFRDAARFYEAYGQRFPRAPKAADALYNAVLLRVTAQDHTAAISDGKLFMARFPSHAALDDVVFLIGRAHAAAGNLPEAAATYRQFAKRGQDIDRRVEALTRLGKVLAENKDPRGADAAWNDATSEARQNRARLKDGRFFAAEARYLQGDEALREFDALKVEGDLKGLSARLKQKAKLLQKAAAIYADVVDFQEAEWVTGALYKIGRSYESFAKALNDAPMPEGLSEEEQQVYRDQLAMFVVPIEERALDAYAGGYRTARELGIYNRWTALMREGLTRLNDVEYPPIGEIGGEIAQETPLPPGPVLLGLTRRNAPPRSRPQPNPRARESTPRSAKGKRR